MFNNNKSSEFASAFAAAQPGGQQYPFLYPTPYMPAQFGLQGNSDMGALIAMFAGPLMSAMAGPENFIPHLMPSQNLMDQYAMRNYQRDTLESSLAIADSARGPVAERLLGMRKAFTDEPVTQLNREQADNLAGMLSHPITKAMLGSVMGPETLEAMLYGSKGDLQALNTSIAKTGFFRTDPMGGGRMKADSLTAYTESLYAHLYEPEGNLNDLEADARKGRGVNPFRNRRIKESQDKLKEIAGMEDVDIVSDDDVATRLQNMENSPSRISRLYKKYVANGTAVTAEEQAKELVKFDRAIKEAGVLDSDEATIGQIRKEAEKAPVKRMHGFMASQVGEMQQSLFEQGLLPQSLGDMSAEDRMRTVGETTRDDETIERLARRLAKQELEKDATFKDLSTEQQNRLVDEKMPDAVKTLRSTETELNKYIAGDRKAMSIEELEKQGGMNLLTVDADTKRAGTTVEKYSGALASIRELFGDNGNPNAPVASLIKMLNALTNSTMGQFEPGRIEAELRKMQTLAKETGTGLEQLAAISTNVTNQGRMFGLNDATAVQATNATLAGIKVMRQDGAFSSGRFGSMNQGQATDMLGRQIQAGAGSNNAKAMAALARIYEADPKKYAGTELEAAVKAYKDPASDGVYIDPATGKEKNIYQNVGTYGPGAARQILSNSNNGDTSAFNPAYYDPLTEEYAEKMGGFMTQSYEGELVMKNTAVLPAMRQELANDKNLLAGLDDVERKKTSDVASAAVTTMLVDTALMSADDRNKYFAENLEVEIAQKLKDSGVPDAEADSRAKELAASLSQPATIDKLASSAGMTMQMNYGMNLREYATMYQKNRPEEIAKENQRADARAAAKASASLGYESGPVQRMSDYLAEINASGERFTASGFMDAVMPHIKDEKVARQFFDKLNPGFETLSELSDGVFVTDSYIDELAKADNFKELKKLADPTGETFTDKTKILSGKQLDAARNRIIQENMADSSGKLSAEKVNAAYSAAGLGKGVGLSTEEKLAELKGNKEFLSRVDSDVYKKEGAISEDRLVEEARGARGKAREGMEQRAEDLLKIQAGYFYGNDPEKTKQAVNAAFRSLDISMSEDELKKFQELTLDQTEEGKKKLNDAVDELWISGGAKEDLKALLTSAQEATKLDPAAMGLTDQAGNLQQTADGVVDKTNIEAQTVVLNATRYVDKDGQPLFSEDGPRGTAIQQNKHIREQAEKMVDEHYSEVGMLGNSTPFSDAEVGDAAVRLADTLGISQEDAAAIMKSIQAERQQNTNASTVVSALYPDNLEYTTEKDARSKKTAQDIIATDYKGKTDFSRGDVDTAAKKLSAAAGIPLPEAKAILLNELEQKSANVEQPAKPSSSDVGAAPKRDRPLPTASIKGADPEKAAAAVVAANAGRQAAKEEREKEAVKRVTGVEYATVSKGDVEKMMSDPETRKHLKDAIETGGFVPPKAREGLEVAAGRHADRVEKVHQRTENIELQVERTMQGRRTAADVEQIAKDLTPVFGGQAGGPNGQQNQNVKISGTLSLNGLQEVLLSARGQQSVPVEGSGAPVIMDPPPMYSNPHAPQHPV